MNAPSTVFSNMSMYPQDSHLQDKSAANLDMDGYDINRAKARGSLKRYSYSPSEPSDVRNITWRCLVDSRVDSISTDRLGMIRQKAKGWRGIRHMDDHLNSVDKDLMWL
jgi:hypothetical protein